jgi:hypothetical protein
LIFLHLQKYLFFQHKSMKKSYFFEKIHYHYARIKGNIVFKIRISKNDL